MTTANFNR